MINFSPRPEATRPAEAGRSFFPRWHKRFSVAVAVMLTLAVFAPKLLLAQATNSTDTNQAVAAIDATTNDVNDIDTNRMNDLDDKYKLAVGDHLSFQILEDEDDPQTLPVTDSGEIDVPYIGRCSVVGKTCKELAGEIKIALEKKYYKQATVIISVDAMITKGIVYLVGPVRAPGPLEIPRDETLTLSKAILRAGGFIDEEADEKHVRVTRDGKDGATDRQSFVVDVYRILNKGETEKDMVLQPGDLIYVPERLLRF